MKTLTQPLAGWGKYPVQTCHLYRPERYSDLKPKITARVADNSAENCNSIIAHGQGRSYGDAALNDQGAVMLTQRLNRFLAFDKNTGILQAEAGVTLAEILNVITPAGWFLPVTPGTQFATIGGCVAVDAHGKNHHHAGSFGNYIKSFELITADNDTLTCTPDQHNDLFWATIGGMGLTGFIGTVTLQLQKIASTAMAIKHTAATDLNQAFQLLNDPHIDDQYSVAWIDCLATGNQLGRSIIMTAHHANIDELPTAQRAQPLIHYSPKARRMPINFPGWVLNPFSIRLFNEYYYRSNAQKTKQFLQPYSPYFYPLDKILEWNRMYGKKGFVQYQCVLPTATAQNGLQQLLEKLSQQRCASFLAVLKRFGAASKGLLSFPMPGFSLALDIPLRDDSILSLLNDLDRIVLQHQGRVYLAKDARLSPEAFRQMYPQYQQWLTIKKSIDPNNIFSSSLARRLQLMAQ